MAGYCMSVLYFHESQVKIDFYYSDLAAPRRQTTTVHVWSKCRCVQDSGCWPVSSFGRHQHAYRSLYQAGMVYIITLPQTVRLFYVSLCSQAPQQQYTVLSFSSMRRHDHSHKLTSSHALRQHTVGKPFRTSCKRQSQTTEKQQYCMLQLM